MTLQGRSWVCKALQGRSVVTTVKTWVSKPFQVTLSVFFMPWMLKVSLEMVTENPRPCTWSVVLNFRGQRMASGSGAFHKRPPGASNVHPTQWVCLKTWHPKSNDVHHHHHHHRHRHRHRHRHHHHRSLLNSNWDPLGVSNEYVNSFINIEILVSAAPLFLDKSK